MGIRALLATLVVAVLLAGFSPLPASADIASSYTMWKYLNDLRASVGAPPTREDSRVDIAAQNHANYLSASGTVGHYETAGAAYYTGYAPRDRLAAAGYITTFVSEVAASYNGWQQAMTELWAAPYHRLGMMHPHNIVAGWGHSDLGGRESTVGDFVYDFNSAGPSVVRSPAAGQTGVPTSWSGTESPNPLPAGASRPVGYPIMVIYDHARATTLRSASVVRMSDGAGVPLYFGTQQFEYDYAFVIPQSPLAKATTYLVRMDLTVGGQPVTESWSFTTSADAQFHLTTLHSAWSSQTYPPTLAPGQTATASVRFTNTGTQTWQKGVAGSQVTLGVNGDSTWYADHGMAVGWLSANRVATTVEDTVVPGQIGTFTFQLRAPSTPGTYNIPLRPVVDGVAWLEDQGVYVPVVVDLGFHSAWVDQTPFPTVHAGDVVSLYVRFRNTGATAWTKGVATQELRLGIVNDDTRWAPYAIGWLSANRAAAQTEAVVSPGGTATLAFQFKAPSLVGTYDIRVRPVIDGVAWLEDQGVYLRVVVQ